MGSTEKKNEQDARDVESEKRQQILDGAQPATITPIKLSELAKKYRETHAKGTRSASFYDVTLKVLERCFNDPLITDISHEDCDAFWNDRKATRKLSTARTSLIVLKHLFAKAADWKHIRKDAIPTNRMEIPKLPKPSTISEATTGGPKAATMDEVTAILAAADGWFRPYLVLLLHGARRDEGHKLDWSDVSLPFMLLTFRDTKSSSDRTIPITPELATTLRVLRSRAQGGPVFLKDGHRITINEIRSAWARARRKAGVTLRLHDLRHTWASFQLGAGVPVQTVAERAGWNDLKMVLRYAHGTQEGDARPAGAESKLLTPSPATTVRPQGG